MLSMLLLNIQTYFEGIESKKQRKIMTKLAKLRTLREVKQNVQK